METIATEPSAIEAIVPSVGKNNLDIDRTQTPPPKVTQIPLPNIAILNVEPKEEEMTKKEKIPVQDTQVIRCSCQDTEVHRIVI